MLKLAILAILSVPSIMATSTSNQMAKALIAEKDTEKLGQTFQDLRKEHDDCISSWALTKVVEQGHPEITLICLRSAPDPFPNDKMCVSALVNNTVLKISSDTSGDSESFAKVITSFMPTNVKPLASIRCWTLGRRDAVKVLERVMDKSPELITTDLASWLASHGFHRNSLYYTQNQAAREGAFQYLASFATESVLEEALSIVTKNEHYKVNFPGGPKVWCCDSQDDFPQDLVDRLTGLLKLMEARNVLIRGVLQSLLPKVLVDLMLDYLRTDTI
jgi:hypothetical protein